MADLSDSVNWFEIDNSNNKASPNGWPEGMMPSGVNDSARADKGALKRFWDRINPVQSITPAGGVYNFVTTNPAYPAAYVDGEVYCFTPAADSVGNDQFQVNSLASKPIWKRISSGTGFAAAAAIDIVHHLPAQLIYGAALNGGTGAFLLVNPFLPLTGDGTGGIGAINGAVISVGPNAGITFADRSDASVWWSWYANAGIARLHINGPGGSSDRITVDASGNLSAEGYISAIGGITANQISAYDALNFRDRSGTPTWSWFSQTGLAQLFVNGAAQIWIDGAGSLTTRGEISATGNLHTGLSLFLGGDYILFNGNNSVAQGPFMAADNTNFTFLLGSGGGRFYFNNQSGPAASIDASGNVRSPMLRGGYGAADAGVLKCWGTGDTIGFEFNAAQAAYYFKLNNVTSNIIVFSDNLRNISVVPSGGGPTGSAILFNGFGGAAYYVYVDTPSDARLKDNIADSAVDALAALCAVPLRRFDWRPEMQQWFGLPQPAVEIGLVAQEVMAAMPDCVGIDEHEEGGPLLRDTHVIKHDRVEAYLIRAVQQLAARLAQLETK